MTIAFIVLRSNRQDRNNLSSRNCSAHENTRENAESLPRNCLARAGATGRHRKRGTIYSRIDSLA
jgi:hypothetical protein